MACALCSGELQRGVLQAVFDEKKGILMKVQRNWVAGIITLLSSVVAHADRVEVGVDNLLAPLVGFEQKNNIQVVLYGTLPNHCYSLDDYQVERAADRKTVRVRQFAQREQSGLCADEANLPEEWKTPIPFTSEISAGHLEVGDVTFQFKQASGQIGSRLVRVSPNTTLSVDSLPYAAVSNLSVADVIRGDQEVAVTLSGVLNSSCTELDDEVRVDHQPEVFVLLPTVKTKRGALCLQVLIPFEKKVNLGRAPEGRYLIHARSMNGRAVNRVVTVVR